MRPSMFMGGGGLRPAQFVGSHMHGIAIDAGTAQIAQVPGIAPGDYAFIVCVTNSASGYFSTTSPGWAVDNFASGPGYRTSVFHKRISDLSNPVISNPGGIVGGAMIFAYRGVGRAARRSVVDDKNTASSGLIIPGFVRNTDCVGVVSVAQSRTDGITTAMPSGDFIRRAIGTPGVFTQTFADALPRPDYVDGGAVSWSALTNYKVGMLYELRL